MKYQEAEGWYFRGQLAGAALCISLLANIAAFIGHSPGAAVIGTVLGCIWLASGIYVGTMAKKERKHKEGDRR